MTHITFLQDLAVVMIVAALVTVIFRRLHQPVVLGYIIAGVLIGPHALPLPLVQDEIIIKTLAELGVVFLMFSLGLEFSLRKLRRVGGSAIIAGSLELLFMFWIGFEAGRLFGWRTMDSLFCGAVLSISSTMIIVRTLRDLGRMEEKFAELIIGILIVEDVAAIIMIALLPGLAMTGSVLPVDALLTAGRIAIFLIGVLVLGFLTVPRLIAYVARFKSDETLLITVLGLCLGVSMLAAKLGLSVALGAFVIGAIIAETREIGTVEVLTAPLRDMFSAIFFVAIGMLIDPALLVKYAFPIVVLTVAVIGGKTVTCAFGTFVAGHGPRTSLRVGMGLAQIGEFSFIIAALGLWLGVTSEFLFPIVVCVSMMTTVLTPQLVKRSDQVVGWIERRAPAKFVAYLELYGSWIWQFRRAGRVSQSSPLVQLLRRVAMQLALNVVLIVAVLVLAALAAPFLHVWAHVLPVWMGDGRSLLWLCAILITSPVYVATIRKLQALGMLVSDVMISPAVAGRRTAGIRAMVATTVTMASLAGLGVLTVAFSSALLPAGRTLFVLLGIMGGLAWMLRRALANIYAKAQVAIQETLAQPWAVPEPSPAPVHEDVQIDRVVIAATSPAAGRSIRDLQLREQVGASVAGLERNGEMMLNPGQDAVLLTGDRVILLGTPGQLSAARERLLGV